MHNEVITKPVKIPALPKKGLLGNASSFSKDRLSLFTSLAAQGDMSSFQIGPIKIVYLNSADLVHELLVEKAEEFIKPPFQTRALQPWIGNGLFTSEGELHKKQRKLIAPSFQPRHISTYANIMTEYTEKAQQQWLHKTRLDLAYELTVLTMSIVGKAFFDVDIYKEAREISEAIEIANQYFDQRISNLFMPPLSWPTAVNRRARAAKITLTKQVQAMIKDRRTNPQERHDILSVLLKAQDAQQGMDDQQLQDEVLTAFTGGVETTSNALAWCFYLLTQNPGVYNQLQNEVDTVLQGRSPEIADLPKLPFTQQVFKETLRLYPSGYAIFRQASKNYEIGGQSFSKWVGVGMSPYTLHRRPDYFPQPERFEPSRFSPENERKIPRSAYLPFGAGPRICIGNHFATIQGQLVLATLAQRVSFELVPGSKIEPAPMVTIRLKNGLPVTIRQR